MYWYIGACRASTIFNNESCTNTQHARSWLKCNWMVLDVWLCWLNWTQGPNAIFNSDCLNCVKSIHAHVFHWFISFFLLSLITNHAQMDVIQRARWFVYMHMYLFICLYIYIYIYIHIYIYIYICVCVCVCALQIHTQTGINYWIRIFCL